MSHTLFYAFGTFILVINALCIALNLSNYARTGRQSYIWMSLFNALLIALEIANMLGAFGPTP